MAGPPPDEGQSKPKRVEAGTDGEKVKKRHGSEHWATRAAKLRYELSNVRDPLGEFTMAPPYLAEPASSSGRFYGARRQQARAEQCIRIRTN